MTRIAALAMLVLMLAACTPAAPPTTPTADPASFSRRLATVALPPTPNDVERRATQIAARPTATYRAPTLAITPTVYVGIFEGVEADEPSLPVVDPAQFQGLPGASTPVAPGVTACSQAPDAVFGTAWTAQTDPAMQPGCPTAPATQAQGASLAFERGVMLFIPAGDIWAIQANTAGGPYWHTAQAPADSPWDTPAPDGLQVPALGFGAYWKANAVLRETLGFARAGEAGSLISVQPFERGLLLHDNATGSTWVLIGSREAGMAYGPF